jgi:hypothetical protein
MILNKIIIVTYNKVNKILSEIIFKKLIVKKIIKNELYKVLAIIIF